MEKKQDPSKMAVTIEIPRPMLQKIERAMKEQDRSRAWVVRQLLAQALEQKEKATA